MLFTNRLLFLINEKGINKKKFLDDLTLGKNSIVNWINRDNIPNGETLNRIAEYFDVDVDYLLANTDIKKSAIEADTRGFFARLFNIAPHK